MAERCSPIYSLSVASPSIDRIRDVWQERLRGAPSQLLLALVVATVIGGAHVARVGTAWARATAVALFVATIAWYALRSVRERRDLSSARRLLSRILLPTDRSLGEKALRALSLLNRTRADSTAGSAQLAQRHFDQVIARASVKAVEAVAIRRASRYRGFALAVLLIATVGAVLSPLRLVEGLNVLAAHDGHAPLPMSLLRYPRIAATPPSYTGEPARTLVFGSHTALPKGTTLTIRGMARHPDRDLIVTDGRSELPFSSDGAGGLVARYTLSDTARIRVAARYGDVRIEEHESLFVQIVPDAVPEVVLDGAPRRVELSKTESIDIRWLARDDYGLRQVDLVLRSGSHEDRRVLGRYDGGSTLERGGHVLEAQDDFLTRAFLPVHITVEARDNDPFDGPKWGRSEVIVVVPAVVGEPEAARYRSLERVRDELVDLLIAERATASAEDADQRRLLREKASTLLGRLRSSAEDALASASAGLGVPDGLAAFVRGQLGRLDTLDGSRGATKASGTVEDVLLAFDVALRSLGARDAREVSKRLGDVAEEAATSAKLAREAGEKRQALMDRLDAALAAIGSGAKSLLVLDALGRDLGSVAQSELRRIGRARDADDLVHTELAALHLAERLRRPSQSFGSKSRGGGVESGIGHNGGSATELPPSSANQKFDQLAEQVEQLAREHAAAMRDVEQELKKALEGAELESLRSEAEARARAIRQAVDGMPFPGQIPGTRSASAALAREHSAAMAHALEQLDLESALDSGQNALSGLTDAERRPGDWPGDGALDEVRRQLEEQIEWTRRMLQGVKERARERARQPLQKLGERERQLAEQARQVLEQSGSDAPLPQRIAGRLDRAASVMKDAARELGDGQGQQGLEHQREAQRLLEQSSTGKTTDRGSKQPREQSSDETRNRSSEGRNIATGGDVPEAGDAGDTEDFRRRVLEGLAEERSERLAPAIRRYAEGLLR